MAFPVVEGTAVSTSTGTSHTVSIPASVAVEDLLIVKFTYIGGGAGGSTITFPAGWNKFGGNSNGFSHRNESGWKQADGTEGATITVTTSVSGSSAHNAYRITGYDLTGPASGPVQHNSTTSYDPPNLAPIGGAQDYLWITGVGLNNNTSPTAPTGFSGTIQVGLSTIVSHSSATRELNAASLNASAWSLTGASTPIAWIIAVFPGLLGSPPTAVLSGTVTDDLESDIKAGGSTIILTVTADTWVAAGATFNAQRQNIINGLVSDGAEAAGWDVTVIAALAVSDVVRTSDTIVTITLPAVPAYQITADETITATISATALVGGIAVVAAPTFTITDEDLPELAAISAQVSMQQKLLLL